MKAILIIDNDQDFLDSFAQLLAIRGFTVHKAATIEEARSILRDNFIHMATVDIRMKDDTDGIDILGIRFIQEPEFRYIPKVILTNHPNPNTVREALKVNLSGFVPAVDYIKKIGGITMVDEICGIFDNQTFINKELKFNWHNGGNFPGLIGFYNPEMPPELYTCHFHEMIYLFQMMFSGCMEVNILKRLWDRQGVVALSIHAVRPTREEYFIMTCGDPVLIERERVNFELYGPDPDSITRTRFIRSIRTIHYDANLWKLVKAPYTNLQSFSEDIQKRQDKSIKDTVTHLFDHSLKEWREIKSAVIEISTINRWHKEILPSYSMPDQEEFYQRIRKVANECIAKRTINNLTINSDCIRFTFINHTFVDLPNPLAYLFGDKSLPIQQMIVQNAPGRLSPDTIQIDPAGNTWLTDFSSAGEYTIWEPYAFLESELLVRLVDASNFFNLTDLQKSLLLNRRLDTFTQLPAVATEYKKITLAVQAIREAAARNTGNDPLPYAASLFFISASEFCVDDFDTHLKKEYNQYLHRLLTMSMISTLFENSDHLVQHRESSYPRLRLMPETRCVVRGDIEINLSSTEYDILAYLNSKEGKACTRSDILKEALHIKAPIKDQETNMLNTNISRIREKIELTKEPKYLLTIHGMGYRLVTNPSENPVS